MIKFQLFPRSLGITPEIRRLIDCFEAVEGDITSATKNLTSNKVLEKVRNGLESIGFQVESGKSTQKRIAIPVLFGLNSKPDKYFNADAVSSDGRIVLEVEAGRAVVNNQFLKDIFQACMMFEVEYLAIAVRNDYRGNDDFKRIFTFLETLYISNRLKLPLKGILLIGY
ncbi:MAG: hypothetical protein UZ17_ACD001002192 [Acidobacteria bacterium OLB17]|nr:MAG: hypothetical protein UZ17_ACD001002192 [Acidobacteria bacterium OLB17]MCZ2390800.1 hypothetical protein [Acidobacteriota bacterium]